MSGISDLLTDRMASLLPNTTAGACYPTSRWTEHRGACGGTECCEYSRTCQTSCYGRTVCTPWAAYSCTCPQCG